MCHMVQNHKTIHVTVTEIKVIIADCISREPRHIPKHPKHDLVIERLIK